VIKYCLFLRVNEPVDLIQQLVIQLVRLPREFDFVQAELHAVSAVRRQMLFGAEAAANGKRLTKAADGALQMQLACLFKKNGL